MPRYDVARLALIVLCVLLVASACASGLPSPAELPAPAGEAVPPAPTVPSAAPADPTKPTSRGRVARIVAIDPGHGGEDDSIPHLNDQGRRYREGEKTGVGTYQPDGSIVWEKDLTLDLAQRLKRHLAEMGYAPVLTRSDDRALNDPPRDVNGDGEIDNGDEMQARADAINATGAELFLSLHFNGFPKDDMRGTATFYCAARSFAEKNKSLATMVHDRVWDALVSLGHKPLDRGIMDDEEAVGAGHLILLGPASKRGPRPTRMPGVLAEPLFLTNGPEEALAVRAEAREALARGLALAVQDYLGPADRDDAPIAPTR